MIIERTTDEIIFRLPNNTPLDELQDLADFFNIKRLQKKSRATQTDVDNLVKSIKKER